MTSLSAVTAVLLLSVEAAEQVRAIPRMPERDHVRLVEALRLATAVQDEVWPGWSQRPLDVLLVAEEFEYLVHSGQDPEGFAWLGDDAELLGPVLARPRVMKPSFLATFPAFGATPTIVIGTAEATAQTSSGWVITLLHEHFHQLQYSEPGYLKDADGLGLSGEDRSGMWMLNYPFPYESPSVGTAFSSLASELARLLEASPNKEWPSPDAFWQRYGRLRELLKPPDYRYLSFQLYQEGVARYIELKAAEAAASRSGVSRAFAKLSDFEPYASVAKNIRRAILGSLKSSSLGGKRREAFYAFGAGLALLLDREGVTWKDRYLREKFYLEAYRKSPVQAAK